MDFLVVEIVIVEDGQLLHAGLHLGAQARILLHQYVICLATVRGCINLVDVVIELFDATFDLVGDTWQHLQFQLEPGHFIYSDFNE